MRRTLDWLPPGLQAPQPHHGVEAGIHSAHIVGGELGKLVEACRRRRTRGSRSLGEHMHHASNGGGEVRNLWSRGQPGSWDEVKQLSAEAWRTPRAQPKNAPKALAMYSTWGLASAVVLLQLWLQLRA